MATDDTQDLAVRRHHPALRYAGLRVGIAFIRMFGLASKVTIAEQARRVPKTIVRTNLRIPSRQEGRTIRVTLYDTLGEGQARGSEPIPAHINIHGSGFCISSLGADADFCSRLVTATGAAVFDMTHRMAPEHPFPAGLEDIEDVFNHIVSQPETYDLSRISIGGFSAGGCLALGVATTLTDKFCASVAFYASVDLSRRYTAPTTAHDKGIEIPPSIRRFFYRCYAVDLASLKSARASPNFATTDVFPPHLFMACGQSDSLHDPAKTLVERLTKEGHPDATFLSIERESHAFDKEAKEGSVSAKRKAEMYDKAIETIQRAHEAVRPTSV